MPIEFLLFIDTINLEEQAVKSIRNYRIILIEVSGN